MKQALLITGGTINYKQLSSTYERIKGNCFVLGVDGGCQWALDANITLDAIIGDFDTLDETIRKEITASGSKTITLNPVKNVTDTHAALDYLFDNDYTKVMMFGARGTRLDHTLGNLMIAFSYFPKMSIEIIDEHNYIRAFVGPIIIEGKKLDKYKYLSIIPVEETIIKSSQGLKYPIKDQIFKVFDSFGVSNEILENGNNSEYKLEALQGKFLIIESRD